MNNNRPTVGILTLGCKVNQYESEAVAEELARRGFSVRQGQECCDLYIINTCTVTAESDRKGRQMIRRAIHRNPNAYILVAGCLSQVSPQQVTAIAGVDYVCGNADKLKLADAAETLLRQGRKNATPILDSTPADAHGFEPMRIEHFDRTRAYIKIEDGCENHCSYCIIPAARGSVRSKAPDAVLEEVQTLTEGGCREIVLTGIETASYGKDLKGCDLGELLQRIDALPNIGRIRLGSLDPSRMTQSFVDRIAKLSSPAPHFHLSMQSGSDSVLARMKRKYNSRMALDAMRRLRSAISEVQFTTDIIVGFPGETEEEFLQTLEFVKQARFLMIHVFPYSKRAGTVAAELPNQIPEPIKHERLQRLNCLQAQIRQEILQGFCGQALPVLFETYRNGIAVGHTPAFAEVAVASPKSLSGQIHTVQITDYDEIRCRGLLCGTSDQ